MRKYLCFILGITGLIVDAVAFGQQTEPMLLKVTYSFTHVFDTTHRSSPLTTEMVLRVGKTNSRFNNTTLEYAPAPKKKNEAPELSPKTVTVVGRPMAVVTSKELSTETIFQVPADNSIIKTDVLGFQTYKMELPWPGIDWKIESETRTIGGFACQKATGQYGGRVYTAWFAPSLPFRYGPWKLCGLPGLILEASDSANEVSYKFKELVRPEQEEYIIYDPYRPVAIKEPAFDKAKKVFDKDPVGSSQAQLRSGTSISEIRYRDAKGNTLTGEAARAAIKNESKKTVNNPLEIDRQ